MGWIIGGDVLTREMTKNTTVSVTYFISFFDTNTHLYVQSITGYQFSPLLCQGEARDTPDIGICTHALLAWGNQSNHKENGYITTR